MSNFLCAIETTCDETGLALFQFEDKEQRFRILSSWLRTQVNVHKRFGGVVPHLAAREHEKNLPVLYQLALDDVLGESVIDLFAFSYGPGLAPCLIRGMNFLREKTADLGGSARVLLVNHLTAHLFSPLLIVNNRWQKIGSIEFPAVGLVVSGGHTLLVLAESFERIKLLGETRDDAAGEAFDKAARLLKAGYPGGPAIEKLAREGKPVYELPRPMIHQKNLDFSFSGLKTSLLYLATKLEKQGPLSPAVKNNLAASFQSAIIDVLIQKTKKAVKTSNAKTLLVGGGVIANQALRQALKREFKGIDVLVASKSLATDNALMIGFTGFIQRWRLEDKGFLPEEFDIEADSSQPGYKIGR